jgi:hypothetical protein
MHTIKTQVVYCPTSRNILSCAHAVGRTHDFKMFKESDTHFHPKIKVSADSEYQGMTKFHQQSSLPKKKSKKTPLSEDDKKRNKEISSERVEIENVFGALKRFRIIAEKYRNRRKRFGIRFTIIASIFNKHIAEKNRL